jgi:nucleotide-binding universal stress UspA family protein
VPFSVASHQQEVTAHAAVSEAQHYLHTASQPLRGDGLTVHTEVLPGSPAQAILFAAQVHKVDLIAMSTHGRSGLSHVLLGSVAEEVLRHSECPVLLTRGGDETPTALPVTQRILVPLDGSPLSETALAYLAGERLTQGAHVILLRLVEPPSLSAAPLLAPQASAEFFAYADQQTAEARRVAEEYLSAVGERYLQGVEWEKGVYVGYAFEDIVRLANTLQASMIVMATAGRHGFDRLLYGSVAGRVLRHAPVPVLVVHDVSTH